MLTVPLTDAELVAAIREQDADAMAEAYRRTFQGPIGRLVLAHHLYCMGVGAPIGPEDNRYNAGRHDAALDLADKAGFSAASMAVGVLTGDLEHEHDDTLGTTEALDEDDLLC